MLVNIYAWYIIMLSFYLFIIIGIMLSWYFNSPTFDVKLQILLMCEEYLKTFFWTLINLLAIGIMRTG